MHNENILSLAARHGLELSADLRFNEMGIDFRVVFGRDLSGNEWVLRIPRRSNMTEQIEREHNILDLVRKHVSISVPAWEIATPELIAYPLLDNDPVITFDAETHAVTWNINQKENQIVQSLAPVLCELHQIPVAEAAAAGLRVLTSSQIRKQILDDIDMVKHEIGIGSKLENQWRRWVEKDTLWPDFSCFVHGDLYAGHILADRTGNISGIIDWSEAEVGDPSVDLAGHLAVFGDTSTRELVLAYEKCGGIVWRGLWEQIHERHTATPLKYAAFVIKHNLTQHFETVKAQLGS